MATTPSHLECPFPCWNRAFTYVIVSCRGRSHRHARALAGPRRGVLALDDPRALGAGVRRRARARGPRDRRGRGAPVDRRRDAAAAAAATSCSSAAALDHRLASAPDAHCLPLADYMEEARVHGSPRRFVSGDARRAGRVLLRRLHLRGRHLRPAAAAAARHRAAAARRGQRAAHDDGPARARDAARRPGPADAARPPARRRAGAGPARALRGARATEAPAWFRASGDPQIGPVLRAVHDDPARRWTVEELAAEAHALARGVRPPLHARSSGSPRWPT